MSWQSEVFVGRKRPYGTRFRTDGRSHRLCPRIWDTPFLEKFAVSSV
ncbi:hypothetical protein FRUB_02390 [Fimbriiglobus ruber]|uniref:Uncharacterized protein n=1 Tax=Fimbriiglobus ruber TaxID=1908690 RepID=A0A225E0X2_9BACT|nr:hypothetical protein FRUB_02390 [Fimbriiglobus ruber]